MVKTKWQKRIRKERRASCSSGKRGFIDKIAADFFLATHKEDFIGNKLLKRSYLCPECGKWHLTSKA